MRFSEKLNRNRCARELALKLQSEIGEESARIRIIPVCEDDLKDVWVLDQYRRDADELKVKASGVEEEPALPRLRVLRQEDCDCG